MKGTFLKKSLAAFHINEICLTVLFLNMLIYSILRPESAVLWRVAEVCA